MTRTLEINSLVTYFGDTHVAWTNVSPIFRWHPKIFLLNAKCVVWIKISLKFVPGGQILQHWFRLFRGANRRHAIIRTNALMPIYFWGKNNHTMLCILRNMHIVCTLSCFTVVSCQASLSKLDLQDYILIPVQPSDCTHSSDYTHSIAPWPSEQPWGICIYVSHECTKN